MSKTSTQVKQRWLDKNYRSITIKLPKDLVDAWEAKLAKAGMSKAEFMRSAMKAFLETE